MELCCQQDGRREAVRRMNGWNGLDYVEVSCDQRTLTAYFLGKLPPELRENQPGIERYLRVEGGRRITGITITDVDPVVESDPEKDDYLVVQLDKYGDFSTYTLRLVGVENIDPRYDHADFSFKVSCPSELDCVPPCQCQPPALEEPELNYLAKDYASFRQLIFDRLALLLPDWRERHVPDLGVALAEVLAYTGDYLSYYQDAVATEAYLDTARQRISVRRHVRLVDYKLDEGRNARAWVCVAVGSDLTLDRAGLAFITGLNDGLAAQQTVLDWDKLRDVPARDYEVFEPLPSGGAAIALYSAHNEIHFYTWGLRECCLERGATSATLLDGWVGESGRWLDALKPGDVLIFEEVRGAVTGLPQDADPTRRHAVRLTGLERGVDAAIPTAQGRPTPYVEIRWSEEDQLPFPFCISALGTAPDCRYLDNVSVARGNAILVDHGRSLDCEWLGQVPMLHTEADCLCEGHPGDGSTVAGRFRAALAKAPLTFSLPLPLERAGCFVSAAGLMAAPEDDEAAALPQLRLVSVPGDAWERRYDLMEDGGGERQFTVEIGPAGDALLRFPKGDMAALCWTPRYDLLESGPDDRHFVAEIDNDGLAQLRFGDGELGSLPPAGAVFFALYRVGNGARGNVGAVAISRLVLDNASLDGVDIAVRNPLPAAGGREPEPMAEAKLYAPHLFRKRLERAIVADDYRLLAERSPHSRAKVQRAAAALAWTGSWYEADVAVDPMGQEGADAALLDDIAGYLHRYRRMGHDLHVMPARYVPLDLQLEVCVQPHYQRGHVKAALLDAFGNRLLAGGRRGFFHPDSLTFGASIYVSRIVVAARAVAGVDCVKVTRLQRLFETPNREIENGLLPLAGHEIAQLDNDPSYPERGKLDIRLFGGL